MNPYALSACEADLDKMRFVVEFIELIWSHDDVMEEVPLGEVILECEQLRRAMYELEYRNEPVADNQFGMRIKRFRKICQEMQAIDPICWIDIQDAMEEWLPIDLKLKEWDSLEEYLNLRRVHSGNNVLTTILRWSMGIHLTKDELEFVTPFTDAIGTHLGLMNDVMSWKRERTQHTDRVMNVVHLIMKMYNLPEEVAIDTARGMLVKEDGKVLEMAEDLHSHAGLSAGLETYIDNLTYFAGGWFYWSLLAQGM
ncbi:hypothetical protein NMY22_g254 [Coprinellus aureogranulatus]|nr:hypothetical protein NMY22_g254 [Coprinellus aureogranulatus]